MRDRVALAGLQRSAVDADQVDDFFPIGGGLQSIAVEGGISDIGRMLLPPFPVEVALAELPGSGALYGFFLLLGTAFGSLFDLAAAVDFIAEA